MRAEHTFVLCDALEKVFLDHVPRQRQDRPLSVHRGEVASFQLAWLPPSSTDRADLPRLHVSVQAGPGAGVSLSRVVQVPVQLAVHEGADEDYLRTAPGLYPDALEPLDGSNVVVTSALASWQAVWVDVCFEEPASSGLRDVRVLVHDARDGAGDGAGDELGDELGDGLGDELFRGSVELLVRRTELPELDVEVTQWLHVDCLADQHACEVFDEEHWRLVEAHLASLRACGTTSVLTPLFTPPLDTPRGSRRRTAQLLRVTEVVTAGGPTNWTVDFALLDRWVATCLRQGLRTLEMPPLFTQWGAERTPAWVVQTATGPQEVFGWHVAADDPAYRRFLARVLPAVRAHLADVWPQVGVVWHVSDEPSAERLPAYRTARAVVADLLDDALVVDAVSEPDFVREGLVGTPVIATDAHHRFAGLVHRPWVYHCNAQHRDVSNRFIAMPSGRTRAIGRQVFAAGAGGFLHWGFNYWYAQLSRGLVDPFRDTTAAGAFPAGDAFLVYPGPDGTPWESLRHRAFRQAWYDHRALQLLRRLAGPDVAAKVARSVEGGVEGGVGSADTADPFTSGGTDADAHLRWRHHVDDLIDAAGSSGDLVDEPPERHG